MPFGTFHKKCDIISFIIEIIYQLSKDPITQANLLKDHMCALKKKKNIKEPGVKMKI